MLLTRLVPLLAVSVAALNIDLQTPIKAAVAAAADPEEPVPVPGHNPLTYCDTPTDYILDIENVDVDPNPPQSGKNLTITASGNLKDTLDVGSYLNVQVKLGYITLVKKTFDLCDLVKEINLECPLEQGYLELTKEVALPAHIPIGKYTVLADVYSQDDEKVTCLNGVVVFKLIN